MNATNKRNIKLIPICYHCETELTSDNTHDYFSLDLCTQCYTQTLKIEKIRKAMAFIDNGELPTQKTRTYKGRTYLYCKCPICKKDASYNKFASKLGAQILCKWCGYYILITTTSKTHIRTVVYDDKNNLIPYAGYSLRSNYIFDEPKSSTEYSNKMEKTNFKKLEELGL